MKITLSFLLALTIIAFSQDTPEPEKEKQAAAEELVKIAGVQKNIEAGFTKMMPLLESRATKLGLNEEKKAEFINIYKTWFKEDIDTESMVKKTVQLYTETFSLEELKELTKFHQTDLGKKFISALPTLTRKTTELGMREGNVKQPQLMARLKPFLEENAPHILSSPTTTPPAKTPTVNPAE